MSHRYQYHGVPKSQPRTTVWETGEPRNQCKMLTLKNKRCTNYIDPPKEYCLLHQQVRKRLEEKLNESLNNSARTSD